MVLNFLISKLKNTKNNADFFDSMNKICKLIFIVCLIIKITSCKIKTNYIFKCLTFSSREIVSRSFCFSSLVIGEIMAKVLIF